MYNYFHDVLWVNKKHKVHWCYNYLNYNVFDVSFSTVLPLYAYKLYKINCKFFVQLKRIS